MGTGKMGKEGKNNNKNLEFLLHNLLGHPQGGYIIKNPGSNRN